MKKWVFPAILAILVAGAAFICGLIFYPILFPQIPVIVEDGLIDPEIVTMMIKERIIAQALIDQQEEYIEILRVMLERYDIFFGSTIMAGD